MSLNDVEAPLPVGERAVKSIPNTGDNLFDLTGPDTDGRVLVPCRELIIQPRTADILFAEKAGEIDAGRYLTIQGSLRITGVRHGKFYMRAVGGAPTLVEIMAR